MKIKNLTLSESTVFGYSSNCYLLTSGREAAIVDPSLETEVILTALSLADAKLKYIILTHAHFDHMHTLDSLREATGAMVCVHADDAEALGNPDFSLYTLFRIPAVTYAPADLILRDGDTVSLGEEDIKVVHTPGHTPGCICLVCGDDMITGDTLFDMSVGRTDFPRSDTLQLLRSIGRIYREYPDATIYPGHGGKSTVRRQMTSNPWTRSIK